MHIQPRARFVAISAFLAAAMATPVPAVGVEVGPVRLMVDRPVIAVNDLTSGLHETFLNVYFVGGDPSVTWIEVAVASRSSCVQAVTGGVIQRAGGSGESEYLTSRISFARMPLNNDDCIERDGRWLHGYLDEAGVFREGAAITYDVLDHNGTVPVDNSAATVILRATTLGAPGGGLEPPAAPELVLPADGPPDRSDVTPPELHSFTVNGGQPWSGTKAVPYTLAATDNVGIMSVRLRLGPDCATDGGLLRQYQPPVPQVSIEGSRILTDGQHTLCAHVVDQVGLVSQVLTAQVGVDTRRPVAYTSRVGGPYVVTASGTYIAPSTPLRAAVAEEGSGVNPCTVTIDGPEAGDGTVPCDVGDNGFTVRAAVADPHDGEYAMTTNVRDRAGNSAAHALHVHVDGTGPALGSCEGGPFAAGSGVHSVSIAATDAGVGADASRSVLTGTVDTSGNGGRTVSFTATDRLGNATTKTCTYGLLSAELASPVDGAPVLNRAKAGRVVPVKVELFEDGVELVDADAPRLVLQRMSACSGGSPDGVEQYAASTDANEDGLFRWDDDASHWILNVKVPGAGCYLGEVQASGIGVARFWIESV